MKEETIISYFKQKINNIEELLREAKVNNIDFEDYLTNRGIISIDEFLEFKAKVYNLPVKRFDFDEVIPKDVLLKIPEATVKTYKILPLDFNKNVLSLGVVDPDISNLKTNVIEVLKNSLKIETQIFLISSQDFYAHLEDYVDFESEVKKYINEFRATGAKKLVEEKPVTFYQEVVTAEEGPIIKLFELLVRKAVSLRASDIHLEALPDKARIRFRLFGDLKTYLFIPKDVHLSLVNRVKILANLRLDETRIPQDGRFRGVVQGREIDFRVGILPTINGEKVAIRILDPLIGLRKIKELGLADYHSEIVERNLKKPFGMILVTGPTGSGKTTTLYAMIQDINKEKINLISLEDPVEYKIIGLNQSQVRPEIGYTFAQGLREILRQDPDVILVGEIRDEETAELAIHAALTGHLVFSTLHTNTASAAIARLIDMKIKPYFIPSTLNLVISQRLVRKLCQNCLEKRSLPEDILKEIRNILKEAPSEYQKIEISNYYSRGCQKCFFRGYTGRTGIFEMFEMNDEIGSLVFKEASEMEIIEVLKKQNFISLKIDGIIKASQGLVSLEEVLKIT